MQKIFIYFIALIATASAAMDQPSLWWVKTTDGKSGPTSINIAQSSNLLRVLKDKYEGSEQQPIIIPPSPPFYANDLHLYCATHGKETKDLELSRLEYYMLIDAADKLKNPKLYLSLIEKLIPSDLSYRIAEKWMDTLIRTKAIKEKHTHHLFTKEQIFTKPTLIMSNNGDYFMCDISDGYYTTEVSLCNTKTNGCEYKFRSDHTIPAHFSPNSDYIVTHENHGTYLYDIETKQKHLLLSNNHASCNIIMSDDDKYIISEGRDILGESTPFYTLWKLDESNYPQEIALKDGLRGSCSVLFYPDNQHILSTRGDLYLHDIATQEKQNLTPMHEKLYLINNLTLNKYKTHAICNVLAKNCLNKNDYVLLNIQNLKNVIVQKIPKQSLHKKTSRALLTPLCTAYTHLITHICDEGKTLQLLDTNMNSVAAHTTNDNNYISALAIDNSGRYIASGYADGTIILWDLSHPQKRICGKTLIGSHGIIKKLTFTDNQLLLSQPQFGEFWNTNDPSAIHGTAILWDVEGNQVLNFGNAIVKSTISKNGKKVVVIKAIKGCPNWYDHICYNLDVSQEAYTLQQAFELSQQYKNS